MYGYMSNLGLLSMEHPSGRASWPKADGRSLDHDDALAERAAYERLHASTAPTLNTRERVRS